MRRTINSVGTLHHDSLESRDNSIDIMLPHYLPTIYKNIIHPRYPSP